MVSVVRSELAWLRMKPHKSVHGSEQALVESLAGFGCEADDAVELQGGLVVEGSRCFRLRYSLQASGIALVAVDAESTKGYTSVCELASEVTRTAVGWSSELSVVTRLRIVQVPLGVPR